MWWTVYALGVATLLWHFKGRNAVWGTASLGLIVGVVLALFQSGFNFSTIGKAVCIGAIIGTVFEWLPRLTSK